MNDRYQIIHADVLDGLRQLPSESVQTIITSPPFWELRNYGIDGQIGLENSPDAWAARLVEVFREARRVLRKDGTFWLECGDCYASTPNGRSAAATKAAGGDDRAFRDKPFNTAIGSIKPKDLIGLPWLLAFALRADGWWLRSDIIWHKPNPMPTSQTDRPTTSKSYLFLLTKAERYFYDADAIREPNLPESVKRLEYGINDPRGWRTGAVPISGGKPAFYMNDAGRNKRDVWTIPTQASNFDFCLDCKTYYEGPMRSRISRSKDAEGNIHRICYKCGAEDAWVDHYAMFAEDLVKPCILAGTSEKGACPKCSAGWVRIAEASYHNDTTTSGRPALGNNVKCGEASGAFKMQNRTRKYSTTIGWEPSCSCHGVTEADLVPCVVLDPFAGAATTLLVALKLGRCGIGIELNPGYVELAHKRLAPAAAQEVMKL